MVKKTECPICGKYKKPWYELCYECNQKSEEVPSMKELENQEYKKNANHKFHKVESNSNYPHHSILYRDLHYIEDILVRTIFDSYGWTFEKQGIFGTKTTSYTIKIEENNWDLIIYILDSPEAKLKKLLKARKTYDAPISIGIEYKSSINEWGKQIDSFFRQIKTRIKKNNCDLHILFSFDKRFEE